MNHSLSQISNDYLALMQSYLIGSIFRDPAMARILLGVYKDPSEQRYFDTYLRENGADVPKNALTIIGAKRMANIRTLAEMLIRDQIEGDFIETGVWRGGASIFMRAILLAYEIKDTLPIAPIKRLALLRLDGDLYESTMDALNTLYAKLSPGGYVIVDDYIFPPCKLAIHDFFKSQGIDPELVSIDEYSVYWRKSAPDTISRSAKAGAVPVQNTASTALIASLLKLNQVVITKLAEALTRSEGRVNLLSKKFNSLTSQGKSK